MGDINVGLTDPATRVSGTLGSGVVIGDPHPQLHVEERTRLEDLRVKVVNDDATASAIVYTNGFRGVSYPKPTTSAANMTWKLDGVGDNVEIQAAIDAVASFGGGSVKIVGPPAITSATVKLRTGVMLEFEGLGSGLKASANFSGTYGMVMLYDNTAHATILRNGTLDGNSKNVHGIHYIANGGQVFTSYPSTNPDPVHMIDHMVILNCGNPTFSGHGLITEGPNLRGCRYSNLSIRFVSGCSVWVKGSVDSHYTDIDGGSAGDSGLGYSNAWDDPAGIGLYVGKVTYDGGATNYGGDQNKFVGNKFWYSYGEGAYIAGVRNRLIGNEFQDNGGSGVRMCYGKNVVSANSADSNGSRNGSVTLKAGDTGTIGRAGIEAKADGLIVKGNMAFDKAEGQTSGWQQQYGIEVSSGTTNSIVKNNLTYGNAVAGIQGTAAASSYVTENVSTDGK